MKIKKKNIKCKEKSSQQIKQRLLIMNNKYKTKISRIILKKKYIK